jgi:AraC-like DNA-binding protein
VLRHQDENTYLLHYLRRGSMEHVVQNRSCLAVGGDAVLMDLGERTEYRTSGPQPVDLYWLTFAGPDLAWWFQELRAGSVPVFHDVDRRAVESLFRQLVELVARPRPGSEARISGLVVCLLAELLAVRDRGARAPFLVRQPRLLSEPMRRVLDHMALFHDQRYPIKEYAAVAALRPSHFVERFHREVGITPAAWLARYRVERAKQLLDRTDRPIGEIGRLVGQPAPKHFARLFRRVTGQTPRQYRLRRTQRR